MEPKFIVMLTNFLMILGLQTGPEPVEAYTAVLQEMHRQFPERQVVLTETVARPECTPHCEDSTPVPTHPASLLTALEREGVIVGTCTPEPQSIGCGTGREVWSSDRMVVTLSPIRSKEDRTAEVTAMVLWREEYQGRGIASLRGYTYRLREEGAGQWRVVDAILTMTA